MKRFLLYASAAILALVLVVASTCALLWWRELHRLASPDSVKQETGLDLPPGAHIVTTRARVFSLTSHRHFSWLLGSDASLMPWAKSNMSLEPGWENVRFLNEVGDFQDEELARSARFAGAWRRITLDKDQRQQTSYLYLSDDGSVAILETFRP